MNIYVGNIAYTLSDDDLKAAFEAFGAVKTAKIIMDRDTGRSKGFGFVEMEDREDGLEAIEQMNGRNLGGRELRVNEARPRPTR